MASLANTCIKIHSFKWPFKIATRTVSGNPNHWANVKKKILYTAKALKHFDEFYISVYGRQWQEIREAMLETNHKYVAILNNHSDIDRVIKKMENMGAMDVKKVYNVYKDYYEEKIRNKKKAQQRQSRIQQYELGTKLFKPHAISSPAAQEAELVKESEETEEELKDDEELSDSENTFSSTPVKSKDNNNDEEFVTIVDTNPEIRKPLTEVIPQSIEKDVETAIDNSRIIQPSVGMSSAMLFDFVPASEIKGMDDYLLESEHFNFYKQGKDFKIEVEEETDFNFPEYLHIYTFSKGDDTRFPRSEQGSTGVMDYFVLDGASILPVLCLDLEPGDRVLDMCAAPGGKSVAILQTQLPALLRSNDVDKARSRRIQEFFDDVFLDTKLLKSTSFVTKEDACLIADKEFYNKILVDVPCTTDRFALHSNENNLFKPSRVQERLSLPQAQSSILTNALKIVDLGGTVVYSTCTLSPIQNDGVVQASLKQAFDETGVVFTVKNQTKALYPFAELFRFASNPMKYGHLVVPTLENNWGPMYFCKMVRVE